jgi:hypothetical protein
MTHGEYGIASSRHAFALRRLTNMAASAIIATLGTIQGVKIVSLLTG